MSRTSKTALYPKIATLAHAVRSASGSPRLYLYVVAGLVLVVVTATTYSVKREYRRQMQYWKERLTRTADANQRGLGYWVEERDQDAELLASFRCTQLAIMDRPLRSNEGPNWECRELELQLATIADVYSYAGAYVLDRAGRVRTKSNLAPSLPTEVAEAARGISQREILTIPVPGGSLGYSQLAFVNPVRNLQDTGSDKERATVVGYVVLLTRPEAVTAAMSAGAQGTVTGETVLVALQGGQPGYISPLRHKTAGRSVPAVPPDSPAGLSLRLRFPFFGEYRDYRGVSVLSAARFLPELGWGMVTKVDRSEALADFRQTLYSDIGLAFFRILAIVSVGFAWGRQQRIRGLQADLLAGRQKHENLRQSEERFWVALQNSPVIVFNQDRELRYTWINQPISPWSEGYLGKTDEEIIGVADGGRLSALKRPVLQTGIGVRKEWSFIHGGEERVYDINVQPLRNQENDIVGITCASTDVTELKRTEERLHEYQKVVEGVEEMIVVVDSEYRYLLANRAFLNYRGLQRQDLIGHSVAQVLRPGVFEHVLKAKLDECLLGRTVIFEMTYDYPRLGKRDLFISYFPIEGRKGFDRVACVLKDVTDSKRAEKALRESETRYRLLFEHNPAGMFRSTLDGRLLEANDAFARMFGYASRDELLLFPNAHFYMRPEERAPLIARLQQEGALTDYEFYGRHRDGSAVWVLANIALAPGGGGNPEVLEGTFVDITARKNAEEALHRSEAQLRAFIENAPYGIFRYAQGRFVSANPALVRMLGYNTEAEVTALRVASDVFSEDSECRELLELSRQRAHFGPLQAQWKQRDGHPLLVRLSGRIIPGPQNGHLIVEAIVEDVTQQHALEEHLRQADKMEALSRLATGIAHDFNNLLQGITLNLEHVIAATGTADTPLRQELEETLLAAKNAGVITRQLLAFGRKRSLHQEPVSLNDVVARSHDLMTRLAGQAVYVSVRLAEQLGTVTADPVQLQQVILNLVVNARDAMPKGGQITVTTTNIELRVATPDEHFLRPFKAGSYVMLEVTDSGIGISSEAISHIFEPFFTTKPEGSGLGLSTSYGIVSESAGYISVRSQLEQGTTVRLYFPRLAEASAARQSA